MTPQRLEMLALLEKRPRGIKARTLAAELKIKRNACVLRLQRMRAFGLVELVGGATNCRWCLPCHAETAQQYVDNSGSYQTRRKRQWKQNQIKQRVISASEARKQRIPAVNSVWSLAA